MKFLIFLSSLINFTVCPTDAIPTSDYEWAKFQPAGTQTVIDAKTADGKTMRCVYFSAGEGDARHK